MIEWVEELRAGLTEEFGAGPKIVTLATADGSGRPHARMVVVRTLTDAGSLAVASDARSRKNDQLDDGRQAEVCVWLPKSRRQFRLSCTGSVCGGRREPVDTDELDVDGLRKQVWTEMSEASRATFFWPKPADPRIPDDAAFPAAVRAGPPPDNFEILFLRPREVDLLELNVHPHRRRIWDVCDGAWKVREVNP
jgi:PPOX class probable FMN-dependent enzyme